MIASQRFTSVVVFGAGAVGSFLGARLSRVLPVTLVARGAHLAAMRDAGLCLSGTVDEHYTPRVIDRLEALPADALVVVAVKAPSLDEAAALLAEHAGRNGTILCIQNGLAPDARLRAALARRGRDDVHVLRAITSAGCTLQRPGTVQYWGGGFLLRRCEDDAPITELLRAAGIKTETTDDLVQDAWRKFAVNCVANALAAILGSRNRELITPELADLRHAVAREVAHCAQRRGVSLGSDCERWIDAALAGSNNVNSMLQDMKWGRTTEIDDLNGAVVRMAEEDGTSAPANATLAGIVRFMSARGAGPSASMDPPA
jgi:2-dehydropantoate 2-reductase